MLLPILATVFSLSTSSWFYFFLFLFGLAVGSFLDVVSLRYDPDKGLLSRLTGRSHCFHCGRKLSWYELVPLLSFVIQLGRCRTCGAHIAVENPIVEFLSGLIFVLVPLSLLQAPHGVDFFGKTFYPWTTFTPKALAGGETEFLIMSGLWILVFSTLLLVSVIDFRLKIIPDRLNLFLLGLGGLALAARFYFQDFGMKNGESYGSFLGSYAQLLKFSDSLWVNFLGGAVFFSLFFAFLFFITRGQGIGFGDVKLALPLGLLLGYPDILPAGILSFMVGGAFGATFLVLRKKGMKDSLPFAPFMVAGVTLIFLFGYHIINAYFHLFKF